MREPVLGHGVERLGHDGVEPGRVDVAGHRDRAALVGGIDEPVECVGGPLRTESATTITHAVTVAAGVFAPGQLGELTQYLPSELVDDVLEQTGTVRRRLRDPPSGTGVYFLLALGLYPRLGHARAWDKLTAGLHGIAVRCPLEKACVTCAAGSAGVPAAELAAGTPRKPGDEVAGRLASSSPRARPASRQGGRAARAPQASSPRHAGDAGGLT